MKIITLENEVMRLRFIPECGGKMVSLFGKANTREHLWTNPHLPLAPPQYGTSYVEKLDSGGWDEIFPSVDPCTVANGLQIPDHGELVQLPWDVLELSENSLAMAVTGHAYPIRFERRVMLEDHDIQIHYRLEHLGSSPLPWLWCAHPLLPFSSQSFLKTPTDSDRFRVVDACGLTVPLSGKEIRLDELPARSTSSRWAAKLFSKEGALSTITYGTDSGGHIAFHWNPEDLPYVGLWINHGGWSGCGSAPYYNIGIEPTNLPGDDLSKASAPPLLAPDEEQHWNLRLSVH